MVQRVRVGLREDGTKAMKTIGFGGLESPYDGRESHSRNSDQFHFHSPVKDSRYTGPPPSIGSCMVVKIHLDDEGDRWRFVCPRGHRTWEPTNHHFWCQACAESPDLDIDPVFHELHDLTTGDELERGDVRLVTEMGEYADIRRSEA